MEISTALWAIRLGKDFTFTLPNTDKPQPGSAVLDIPVLEGCRAELIWLIGYILR